MTEKIEFGSFSDNDAALQVTKYIIERATDCGCLAACCGILEDLREHIRNTNDPRSDRLLLPHVLAGIERPKTREKSLSAAAAVEPSPAARKPGISGEFSTWQWSKNSLEKFLKTFGPQESFLCMDFLLVLSVLGFSVVISTLLSYIDVELKHSVGAIMRVTDICLVAIFCAECIALLTVTAMTEVVQRARQLGCRWRQLRQLWEIGPETGLE